MPSPRLTPPQRLLAKAGLVEYADGETRLGKAYHAKLHAHDYNTQLYENQNHLVQTLERLATAVMLRASGMGGSGR